MSMSLNAGPSKGRGRRRQLQPPEINVTPLVDVMLVLLVIFMITIQAAKDSIPMELPEAKGVADSSEKAAIEVSVDALSIVHVGSDKVFNLALVDSELPRALSGHEKQPINLSADKKLPYEIVVKVVNAIRQAGIETVNLSVQGM